MDKKGLIWLAGVCFLLAGGLTFKFLRGEEVDTEMDSPKPLVVKNYLKAPKPSGTLAVKINRQDSTLGLLADMNDRGDYLFLTSRSGVKLREYNHTFDGISVEKRSLEDTSTLRLSTGGHLATTSQLAEFDSTCPVGFPFETDQFKFNIDSDKSYFVVRTKHDPKTKMDHYGLDRDTQSSVSPNIVDSQGVKNVPNSDIPNGQASSQSRFSGAGSFGSATTSTTSKEIFRSAFPIALLCNSDLGTIWVRERNGNNSNGNDKLIRIDPNSSEEIKFPAGYRDVMRVANTGENLVATFGKIDGDRPLRAHLRVGNGWRELPIPEGYDFSFVQKVMTNGAMIGNVTTTDGKNIRQVAWLGDACVILNDLPNWPKQGLMSVIILANRQGDIYVRNVLNTETNASEYYLLNVSIKP
ncbi:MAG: hypothetical protein WCI55_16990 [Armatimonadota bacterium]